MPDSSNSEEGSDSEVSASQSVYSVSSAPTLSLTYDAETLQENQELQTMLEDLKKVPEGYIVAPELSKAECTELAKDLLSIYKKAGDAFQLDLVLTSAYLEDPESLLDIGDVFAKRPCYTHAWKDPEDTEADGASVPGSQDGAEDIDRDASLAIRMGGELKLDESETQPEQRSSAAHTRA
jgi:hypothetical protein